LEREKHFREVNPEVVETKYKVAVLPKTIPFKLEAQPEQTKQEKPCSVVTIKRKPTTNKP